MGTSTGMDITGARIGPEVYICGPGGQKLLLDSDVAKALGMEGADLASYNAPTTEQAPASVQPVAGIAGIAGETQRFPVANTSLGAALAAGPPPTPNNTNGPDKDGPGTMIT